MEVKLVQKTENTYTDYARSCIDNFVKENGVLPKKNDIENVLSTNHLIKMYGSWKNTLTSLGFTPIPRIKKVKETTKTKNKAKTKIEQESIRIKEERFLNEKNELSLAIKDLTRELVALPTYNDLKEAGIKKSDIIKYFGSIKNVVSELKLETIEKESVSIKIMEHQSNDVNKLKLSDLNKLNIKQKQIYRLFGNWKNACEELNLEGLRKDAIKEEVINITKRTKKVPRLQDLSANNISVSFIANSNKKWSVLKKEWNLQEIEDNHIKKEIYELSKVLDNTPKLEDLKEYKIRYSGLVKRNNGWANVLKSIGLPKRSKYSYSQFEMMEEELLELSQELSGVPSIKDASKEGISTTALINRYGSWSDVLINVGLTPKQFRSEKSILFLEEKIISLCNKLNKTLTIADFKENKLPTNPLIKKYGSLENFYIENGIKPNKFSRKNYDKNRTLNRLFKIVEENEGKVPTIKEAKQRGINTKCLCEDLGSWSNVKKYIKDSLLSETPIAV